jgi:thymidylate synthase (FAD)
MIERAGRVCYKSEDKITNESAPKFIKMLLARNHEAVLEHACASILFICDRGVSHELVRHRLASYCQESTRYCNYGSDKFSNEIKVIEPPLSPEDKILWEFQCKKIEESYLIMISEGVSPQIARSILPTCLKTEIVVTTNFREWRHILKLRTSNAAHPQIREIMELALKILKDISPTCFEGIK